MHRKYFSIISVIVLLIVIGVLGTPTVAQGRAGDGDRRGDGSPPQVVEAAFVASFDSEPPGISVNFFSLTLGGEVFDFIFTPEGDGYLADGFSYAPTSGQGGSGAIQLRSGGYQLGTIERIDIKKEDGSDFVLDSIYIDAQDSEPVTVAGFYNDAQVGVGQTVDVNSAQTLNFSGLVVDEVRLTSRHFGHTYMDNFAGDTTVLRDHGDLPASYGMTSESEDGARHALGSIYLGGCVDAEPDGLASTNADGDDLNVGSPKNGTCVPGDDDEDGVTPTGDWQDGPGGGELRVSFTGGDGCLSGWIDWENDGSFTEPGDQILDMASLASGEHDLTIDVPDGVFSGGNSPSLYARFRLLADGGTSSGCGDDPSLGLTGSAGSGEVEDYVWSFTQTAIALDDLQLGAKRNGGLLFTLFALLLLPTVVSTCRALGRIKS